MSNMMSPSFWDFEACMGDFDGNTTSNIEGMRNITLENQRDLDESFPPGTPPHPILKNVNCYSAKTEGEHERMTVYQGFEANKFQPVPPSPSLEPPMPPLGEDIVRNALILAGAINCNECNNAFTEENGIEVYEDCGHMVCVKCYDWHLDLTLGSCQRCAHRWERPVVESHLVEEHVMDSVPVAAPLIVDASTQTPSTAAAITIDGKQNREGIIISFLTPVPSNPLQHILSNNRKRKFVDPADDCSSIFVGPQEHIKRAVILQQQSETNALRAYCLPSQNVA